MWQALIPIIGNVIEKVLPDQAAQADAKMKLLELAQKGELAVLDAETKMALGQLEVNKVEAGTDMFRGGWRPATGWACVFGLVYQFLLQPILPWLVAIAGGFAGGLWLTSIADRVSAVAAHKGRNSN
mgnify:CR=1 FL=1